jgi:hypothetical protein
MKFMVFPTQAAAIARSRAEAQARNCGPVTTHWWHVAEGETGDFAVVVNDRAGDEDNLTPADRAKVSASFKRKSTKPATGE